MSHWAVVEMLSWVSLRLDSRCSTPSSLKAMARLVDSGNREKILAKLRIDSQAQPIIYSSRLRLAVKHELTNTRDKIVEARGNQAMIR